MTGIIRPPEPELVEEPGALGSDVPAEEAEAIAVPAPPDTPSGPDEMPGKDPHRPD